MLAVMPTGAGKSLCYQLPALVSNFFTVIVSPLVALMDDQVEGLRQNGINATKIHSGQDREINVQNWKEFASGKSKLLYLSPERLMQDQMLSVLKKKAIGLFVIDEAHYIKRLDASWANAVLRISPYAKNRCVLTGTPMPHSYKDLYNIFVDAAEKMDGIGRENISTLLGDFLSIYNKTLEPLIRNEKGGILKV